MDILRRTSASTKGLRVHVGHPHICGRRQHFATFRKMVHLGAHPVDRTDDLVAAAGNLATPDGGQIAGEHTKGRPEDRQPNIMRAPSMFDGRAPPDRANSA